jgi:hypothetical protein
MAPASKKLKTVIRTETIKRVSSIITEPFMLFFGTATVPQARQSLANGEVCGRSDLLAAVRSALQRLQLVASGKFTRLHWGHFFDSIFGNFLFGDFGRVPRQR